jgi:hypothetical protein
MQPVAASSFNGARLATNIRISHLVTSSRCVLSVELQTRSPPISHWLSPFVFLMCHMLVSSLFGSIGLSLGSSSVSEALSLSPRWPSRRIPISLRSRRKSSPVVPRGRLSNISERFSPTLVGEDNAGTILIANQNHPGGRTCHLDLQ